MAILSNDSKISEDIEAENMMESLLPLKLEAHILPLASGSNLAQHGLGL